MTGKEFRALYKQAGYTAKDLAEELGVSAETVRRCHRSSAVPNVYVFAVSWLVVQPTFASVVVAVKRTRDALLGSRKIARPAKPR